MKTTLIALAIAVSCINIFCQEAGVSDPISGVVNAEYIKGDFAQSVYKDIKYDTEALRQNIQGDVVLSFTISKNGKMSDLLLVSSPDMFLTNAAVSVMKKFVEGWKPAMVNNVPVDRSYQIVFRFRIYLNSQPRDYRSQISRLIANEKYDRALFVCNEGIKDNEYDAGLIKLRSEIKGKAGDTEGAKKDHELFLKMEDRIIELIIVSAMGYTRREAIMVGSEIRKL